MTTNERRTRTALGSAVMWPVWRRRPQPPTPTQTMREAFATPTKGRIVPETVTYVAACPCGYPDAKWTSRQGQADKANMPIVIECPVCDPETEAAAA